MTPAGTVYQALKDVIARDGEILKVRATETWTLELLSRSTIRARWILKAQASL